MNKKLTKSVVVLAMTGLMSSALLPSSNVFASTEEKEELVTNTSVSKVTHEEIEDFMNQIGVETVKEGDKEITTITDSQLVQILEFQGISIPTETKKQFMMRANGVNQTVKHGNGVYDFYFSKGTMHTFLLMGGAISILTAAVPGINALAGAAAKIAALLFGYGTSQLNHGKIFRFYNKAYKTSFNQ